MKNKGSAPPSADLADIRNRVQACKPADFDGHTRFNRLSPSQRLDALASLAVFVSEFKGKAIKRGADRP